MSISSDSKDAITLKNERCEEVQAIVDRMPTKGATYVTVIVAVLVIMGFISTFVISYPDTVDGNISLTAGIAPVRLVSNTNGQLELFHADGDTVEQGELLASIQNTADVKCILELESILRLPFDTAEYCKLRLMENEMGEIGSYFSQYFLALSLYKQHLHSDLYATAIHNLQSQIKSDNDILGHVDAEREIRREALNLSSKELKKDSLLFAHKAITDQDMDKQRTSHLNESESYWTTESNRSTVQARIDKNSIEIRQSQVEEKETAEKLLADVRGKRSDLFNQISLWKDRYLLISPIAGKLEYLGFWRDYGYVQAGKEVVSIIPRQQELFGEVHIPAYGVGKIKVGQLVNVKIDSYPYDEYGLIKGEITKVSQMPNLVKTEKGETESYLGIVRFPNGAVTNYGITLNINFESKGTAEIITKDKKLIERLFDNLKTLGTK